VLFSESQNAFDALKDLILQMLKAPGSAALFALVTRRLVESGDDVAVAAIWVLGPGDTCAVDGVGCEAPDHCLHLGAIAVRSSAGMATDTDPRLEGALRRIPIGALDSELCGADPEWIRREGIEGFIAERLVHRERVLGALGVFLRKQVTAARREMLQILAGQLSMGTAAEHAFDEIRRLQQELDSYRRLPRPSHGAPVVSEADLRRFERENIAAALEATHGRVYGRGGAAELLGLKPTTLASRLKKLGLSPRP
jgi:hypothetical protein